MLTRCGRGVAESGWQCGGRCRRVWMVCREGVEQVEGECLSASAEVKIIKEDNWSIVQRYSSADV